MANKEKFGQSGWVARQTRRLYIVNGSDLVTAKKQQAFLPPSATTILSGQPIMRVWSGNNQVFSPITGTTVTGPIYFANADALDHDVQAVGKLPAIYSGDDFEIQVPDAFFDSTKTYTPGQKLYINGTSFKVTNESTGAVTFNSETVVVGVVSKGKIDLGSTAPQFGGTAIDVGDGDYWNQYANAASAQTDNVLTGGPSVWVNDTGTRYVLQFYTKDWRIASA